MNTTYCYSDGKKRGRELEVLETQHVAEVTRYLDDLSRRMRMNRSWVLNTIVHEYARYIEQKNLAPL